MVTNVKKYKYKVWVKILCVVLSVVITGAAVFQGVLSLCGLSFEPTEDEKGFLNSSAVVTAIASDTEAVVSSGVANLAYEEDYNTLLSKADEVAASVLKKYEALQRAYDSQENFEGEYSEDEIITETVETPSQDYRFEIWYSEIEASSYPPLETIKSSYTDFVSSALSRGGYEHGQCSDFAVSHGIYIGDNETFISQSDYEGYEAELKKAKESGYYYLYDNGEISYDEEHFTADTAEKLTSSVKLGLGDTQEAVYLMRVDMEKLYSSAKGDYFNFASLPLYSYDNILSCWCLNQAYHYNSFAHFFMKSFSRSLTVIIAEMLAMLALAVIYLTATGRKKEGGEVRLFFTDYIPFEMQFIVFLGLGAIPFVLLEEMRFEIVWPSLLYPAYFALSAAAAALLLIYLAASLVRAVKSKRQTYKFFLCSLIYMLAVKLFRHIVKLLEYRPKCFKRNIILIGLGYLLINMLLLFTAGVTLSRFAPFSIFVFIFAAAFNALVFYYLSDYVDKLDTMIINTVNNTETDKPDELYPSLQYLAKSTKLNNAKLRQAVDRAVKDERLRSELITNVSHDLKTPLTSIITYIDLLDKCDIEDDAAREYIGVLSEKSGRLKRLIDDLIEASKVTSGVITINPEKLDFGELCLQSTVDAQEEFTKAGLELIVKNSDSPVEIIADGAKAFRVIENLLSNARKYSAPASRVYVSVYSEGDYGVFEIKNISAKPLDIDPQELTQRFVRGDKARSAEGNGLGLSIAKALCSAQGGKLEIIIDGDLFKACVKLPKA